jgi:6-phosphogluconolactonase
MKKKTIDDKHELAVPGDKQETLNFCAEHWIACAKKAIEAHGSFFVALSGGSTPKALIELLTTKFKDDIAWESVHLFWSDERSVPPSDKDSNYHMAMEAGLKNMPIKPENINRMMAEKNTEQNANEYQKLIEKALLGRPFDLMMLGMGDDGHTASLFPGTAGLTITDKMVIANEVPQKKTTRMTMTFSRINHSDEIAIYVLGANKQEMLKKVLIEKGDFPSARVGSTAHKALWIADTSAAKHLL